MTIKNGLRDNGQRMNFETGATREPNAGRGAFHLLPTIVIRRLAQHFERGAAKYAPRNWEKGIPASSFLNSAFRHLLDLIDGNEEEDHFSALIWNIGNMLWTVEQVRAGKLPESLLDMPWADKWLRKEHSKDGMRTYLGYDKLPTAPKPYDGECVSGLAPGTVVINFSEPPSPSKRVVPAPKKGNTRNGKRAKKGHY